MATPNGGGSRASGEGARAAVESIAGFLQRREQVMGDRDLRGSDFGRAYAAVIDEWLSALLGRAAERVRRSKGSEGMALLAVGGYGRRDMCPYSDVDLVLIHRGVREMREVAEQVWYPIWDARLALDHSVRTVKEALEVADDDLRAALGLLDARLVAGDASLLSEFGERLERLWRRRARRFVGELEGAVARRHQVAGEVAFLLEPDLKDGKGGLRDVQALRVAAGFTPVVPAELALVAAANETLLSVRVELQRATGRATDRLVLQEQDAVARALGLGDGDVLMSQVAEAARAVGVASDDAWSRVRSWLAGPRGRVVPRDQPLGPGLVLREGEVDLDGPVDPSDRTLVLRAAAAAAQLGTTLTRRAAEGLERDASGPGDPWPEEARRALVSLLGAGEAAISVQEALDQHGLLVRILPEWQAVRCRPQRNAYHRFTVDRHLMEAAAQAAAFVRQVTRPDLLLVGAWLHDLGKGWPGDHTEAGMVVCRRVAARMGFPSEDVDALVDLVRHHLLLADTATRRDPADPRTARLVAEAVRSKAMLELLAALTEADSRATGPLAWTQWKESLLRDLVGRVEEVLSGREPQARPTIPSPEQAELIQMANGGLLVQGSGNQLTVVAPDRPGLLCHVAGVLALFGLDVLSVDAWSSENGMAVEVYRVDPSSLPEAVGGTGTTAAPIPTTAPIPTAARGTTTAPEPTVGPRSSPGLGRDVGGPPDRGTWERVTEALAQALAQPETLEARLARRARAYASSVRPTAARAPSPRVVTDNEASATSTVVEVWAANAIGVLYRITQALAREGLDIRHAKVLTLGHEVVDSFYVVDPASGKLTDPERLESLEREILAELSLGPGAGRNASGPDRKESGRDREALGVEPAVPEPDWEVR
jgi:[protein-PII] uridylyltransferase